MVGITPRRKRPPRGSPAALGLANQILGLSQDRAGPGHRLLASRGQDHAGAIAVHQGRSEDPLQLLNAGRECRLGHVRSFGGATERAMIGQKFQVAQLSQRRQHPSHMDGLDWNWNADR